VVCGGRRGHDRPRQADLWLPGPDGRLLPCELDAPGHTDRRVAPVPATVLVRELAVVAEAS
jgi:hypothetical protein